MLPEQPITSYAPAMIIDSLDKAARYRGLHPLFGRAFAFLRRTDLENLPDGRHKIAGRQIYAVAARTGGRGRTQARLESHRRYIDIQFVIAGRDTMGWSPLEECRAATHGYDLKKDIAFYTNRPRLWRAVKAGQFAIFFPEDAHAPLAGSGSVHKVVVKVAARWAGK